jgi:REP element-mobilizing transposase RayT
LKTFNYKGKHCYFITCSTIGRRQLFTHSKVVALLTEQIVRTCGERQFNTLAYVVMEDHLHLLIRGATEESNLKLTMTLLRQRTAFVYRRTHRARLWQDGYYERVLRPTDDLFVVIRYIRENPANAGLPEERARYPYVWFTTDTRSARL